MGMMLRGVSLGDAFHQRLKHGSFSGIVHSVFRRVCNLATLEGELYSLALAEVGNSPNSLQVALPLGEDFVSWGFIQGWSFKSIGTNALLIGECFIDLSEAGLWTQKDMGCPLPRSRMLKNLLALKKQVATYSAGDGLGGLLADKLPDSYLIKSVAKILVHLTEAIRSRDQLGVYRCARSLAGLGPGLTPSGDDFLSGFMSSLYWGAKALGFETADVWRCNQEVVRAAKGRTNLISYTQILYASRGQTPEYIHALLQALYYGENQERLDKAIKRVLEMGSTSGGDLLAGIGMAMEFLLTQDTLYYERSARIWL